MQKQKNFASVLHKAVHTFLRRQGFLLLSPVVPHSRLSCVHTDVLTWCSRGLKLLISAHRTVERQGALPR